MRRMTFKEAARAVGGEVTERGFRTGFVGVSTDTREYVRHTAFIAIKGENFDAHDYVKDAEALGAACVIAEKDVDLGIAVIKVADTQQALLDLAGHYRAKFKIPIVAVIGSAGKTTTKDIIFSVLSQKFNALKTKGNLNNVIGLPQTLCGLEKEHEAAVFEMGINDFGEMERMAAAAKPDIAVFTNIGTAHVEKLGDREGVFAAKTEVINYLPKRKGIIIANGADDMLLRLKRDKRTITYGEGETDDYRLTDYREEGLSSFFKVNGVDVTLNVIGKHNAYNAAAAFAVGKVLGLTDEEIAAGLAAFEPPYGRQNIFDVGDSFVINDTYNANLSSVKAALNVLASFKQKGLKTIAVLGDMLELGEQSESIHLEAGAYADRLKIDELFFIGDEAIHMAAGAKRGTHYKTKEEFLVSFGELPEKCAVLIKASRGMAFEEIAERIAGEEEETDT
ncbi:UDP-N-acetylmuramoyl-tripeptide--D-alanyl-D-alanine ligase [Clostridia bacterium]|nr:UDP-N-acetylmuramoyl-tripeptide--D-alanyl-D-alanine ligase [Clostridia bacterium]